MTTDTNCPFCTTAEQYRYVADGELVRAIYPKAPACRYHVLIVPKRHVRQVDQLTEEEAAEIFTLIQKFNAAAAAGIPGYAGYNLLSNNGGPAVRQHVSHCHIHMFLRLADEAADPFAPHDSASPPVLTNKQLSDMRTLRVILAGENNSRANN